MKRPFHVTATRDKLLRGNTDMPVGLYHLHIATAEQLCKLHSYSSKSIKWVLKHLKALADNGYVLADVKPTKGPRGPNFYTLTNRGLRYLASINLDVRAARVDGMLEHYQLIDHTLELNDLLIAAALLQRSSANMYLHSFMHEQVLKRRPYKTTWQDKAGKTQTYTLIPGAFVTFCLRLQSGQLVYRRVLLEHDRELLEEEHHFRRRIRAYLSLMKRQQTVTVAFTTFKEPKRLEQMREWTNKELASYEAASWFRFANLQTPLDPAMVWLEPCWFTAEGQQPIALLSD